MTRTIYVVFTDSYLKSSKRYAFLCNYPQIELGDKIVDPRYSSAMIVVAITFNTNRIQNGLTLKDIYITMVNDKPISQPSGLVNGSIAGSDYDIDLINSKARNYLGENDRIHCHTPEEARKVVDIYYTLGYTWLNYDKTETNYSLYKDESVYSIRGSHYIVVGNIETAKSCDRNIISAKEFIDYYTAKDMEKRNIKVTLEQAIEWYNSGNETLRTLALTVFTEEELTLNMHYIYNKVIRESICINIPSMEASKNIALAELSLVAKYFNGSWKKTASNTGYFLGQSAQGFTYGATMVKGLESLRNIGIVEHNTVMYPGIVYFKEKEDLIKAVKILGDKAKNLFK